MIKKSCMLIIYNIIFLLVFLSIANLVIADGMPAIKYGEEDPDKVFSSIFESRQLAAVELINDSHEQISLFLSVYSLDPGDNLTIMVPLRTLPVDVTGAPIKETDFREKFKIKKAEHEAIRQNMEKAMEKFRSKTQEYLEYAFGSLIWTLPAEYTRQNIREKESYSRYTYEKGGLGGDSYGEPEPIQHYEFDGFSIDVFDVSAGPILMDYLADKGLRLPNNRALDKYQDQYVAVIESKTKPPIAENQFMALQKYVPNSLERLINELKVNPTLDEYEIIELKNDLDYEIYNEFEISSYSSSDEIDGWDLRNYMDNLIDAVFGKADFEGEVLQVKMPLDDKKMFFPLGTSAGWSNNIGDIDILFRVPENKALSLPQSKDAFFDDAHWYLVQMENSNPDFDLESSLKASDPERKAKMEQAGFIYDNSRSLSIILIASILLVYWFGIAICIKLIRRKKDEPVIKNPILWIILGLSLLISIPGAIMLFLIVKPISLEKFKQELLPSTLIIIYLISIIIFFLGVS